MTASPVPAAQSAAWTSLLLLRIATLAFGNCFRNQATSGHSTKRLIHRYQAKACTIPNDRIASRQTGIDAILHPKQLARDDIGLGKRHHPEHEIGLAPRKIEQSRISQDLDDHIRMGGMKRPEHRRQHMQSKPVRTGYAQGPFELARLARQLPLEPVDLVLDAFSVGKGDRPLVRQDEPIRGALEEPVTEGIFERPEPSSHRRLRQADLARRRAKCALARNGEKDAHVAPVHRHPIQKSMNIMRSL